MEKLIVTDITNSEHYTWGDNCDGWHFVKSDSLSVIRESMPQGTAEKLHLHNKSQQFFYILSGTAHFEIEGKEHIVSENRGIRITAGSRHRIINRGSLPLEFLVISEPKSHGDRIDF